MSVRRYQRLCQQAIGRPVEIRTWDGKVHRGIIDGVDGNNVYLRRMPAGRQQGRQFGGFGFGFGGFGGFGFGPAFVWGVALGAIATLVFI